MDTATITLTRQLEDTEFKNLVQKIKNEAKTYNLTEELIEAEGMLIQTLNIELDDDKEGCVYGLDVDISLSAEIERKDYGYDEPMEMWVEDIEVSILTIENIYYKDEEVLLSPEQEEKLSKVIENHIEIQDVIN